MKKNSSKQNNEIIRLQCDSARSMFRIYKLKEKDLKILSESIIKSINKYYRTDLGVACNMSAEKYASVNVTDKTVMEYIDLVLNKTVLSKKVIGKAVMTAGNVKYGSLHNYICAYIADKVLMDYVIPDKEKKRLKTELVNSLIKENELQKVISRVFADYNDSERIANIGQNEHYLKVLRYLKRAAHSTDESERIRQLNEQQMIMKEMPENITDMYPSARSIKRRFILHLGPTNSGKTYSALQAYKKAVKGIYLAPLRLLAYEIFEQMNSEGVLCSMITGEETLDIPFSKHISATVEMADVNTYFDVAVIDECQLISDEQRGGAWTEAILVIAADEIHLCASENALEPLSKLIEMCGDTYTVEYHKRFVPLVADETPFVFPDYVKKNDALIAFSKKSVLKYAEQLREYGVKASVIYGDLPYDVRRNEVARFVRGETDVVISTDAIGMGLNLPVERIVFLEHSKYDGKCMREISSDEVLQIAGRAGRRGMYDIGYYTSAVDIDKISEKIKQGSTPISKARLRFPKNIIKVDMSLSQILEAWTNISYNKEIFSNTDLSREIRLCKKAEEYTDDKLLIFSFATIPFNENSPKLMTLWYRLLRSEINGKAAPDINKLLDINKCTGLADLELLYRKSDLLYYYCTRFQRGELYKIIEKKHLISSKIMKRLQDMCQKEALVLQKTL